MRSPSGIEPVFGGMPYINFTGSSSIFYPWTPSNWPAGLYIGTYRLYDPSFGVWLSDDPLGYLDSPNMSAYVAQSPICSVDPLGLGARDAKDGGGRDAMSEANRFLSNSGLDSDSTSSANASWYANKVNSLWNTSEVFRAPWWESEMIKSRYGLIRALSPEIPDEAAQIFAHYSSAESPSTPAEGGVSILGAALRSQGPLSLDLIVRDATDIRSTYYKPNVRLIQRLLESDQISASTYAVLRYQYQRATKMQINSSYGKLLGEIPPTGKPLWLQERLAYEIMSGERALPVNSASTRTLTTAIAKQAPLWGRGMVGLGIGMSAWTVANSPDKPRALVGEIGGWGGAWAGSVLAMSWVTPFLPATSVFAPLVLGAAGFAGGVAGFYFGHDGADTIYETFQ